MEPLPRLKRWFVLVVALLATAGAALALVPAAEAGTYVHAPCRGYTASAVGGADGGWHGYAGAGFGVVVDECARGNNWLKVDLLNSVSLPAWTNIGWNYDPPADTRVARFTGSWGGYARTLSDAGGGILHIFGDGFDMGQVMDYADATPKPFDVNGLNGSILNAHVGCRSTSVCAADGWGFGWLAVWDPVVTLRDNETPAAGGTYGSAQDDAKWLGVERFNYSASDLGAGVQYLRVYADGQLADQSIPNTNGGRCQPAGGDSGSWLYGTAVPCPRSVTAVRDIDTRKIGDGQHKIEMKAVDAAGNETVLYTATKFVANRPPVNDVAPGWKDGAATANPSVGQLLRASVGAWSGPELNMTAAWQRCSPTGDACVTIPGATTQEYIILPADIGKRLRYLISASNPGGSLALATPLTGVVQAAASGVDRPMAVTGDGMTVPGLPGAGVAAAAAHAFLGRVVGDGPSATCAGDDASLRLVGVRRGRLTVSYGRSRSIPVELTCTRSGRAVADAVLQVATKAAGRAAVSSELRTDGSGRARLVIGRGPSRGVTVGYRMYADDPAARATTTLRVSVRGQVKLRADRRRLRNGQAVTLRGALVGGHVPRRGITLAVEWKDGSRWRPFAQVKTDRHGRFRYAYRFTRTNRLVAYHLRVHVTKGQVDYPFLPAASRAVRILVGP